MDGQRCARLTARVRQLHELGFEVLKLARDELASIQDRIDFAGAASKQVARRVELGSGAGVPVGNIDNRAEADRRSAQPARDQIYIARTNDYGCHPITLGQLAATRDVFLGQVRADERVLN
jgi:hypothetical protein